MTLLQEPASIVVVTHFPSPYQVELFNEVDRRRPGALRVFYMIRRARSRSWSGVLPTHAHAFLDDGAGVIDDARAAIDGVAMVVFNYYNDSQTASLIRARAATGLPWCFWGERPGYRFPWLARVARLGRLGALRTTERPIWGIGGWAVEAYRREFGHARSYLNLPYYSNLARFQVSTPQRPSGAFTFLFSGALSRRKGVDLLARAFRRLSKERPHVRLLIMGEGELESRLRQDLAGCEGVEWVGFKDWDQLPAVYASAHALCVPSRYDGWGLVVPEGLATGLPTIATNRTGAALDLITHGHNGWIVPAANADALYEAMRAAAALPAEEWSAMSARARASVGDHTLSRGAARLLEGVDAALAEKQGRH